MKDVPKKCAVFDLDGVIADSRMMYSRAIAGAMREAGLPASEEEVIGKITPDMSVWINSMRQEHGEEVTRRVIMRARSFVSEEGSAMVEPSSSVQSLFDFFQSGGYEIALVSNAPLQYALEVLERFGLRSYFRIMISCGERGINKHQGLNHVLRETGTRPEEALYICDTAIDVVYAKRAGVRSVVIFSEISWDYPCRERVEKEGPDFIANSIEEVIEWLESRNLAGG